VEALSRVLDTLTPIQAEARRLAKQPKGRRIYSYGRPPGWVRKVRKALKTGGYRTAVEVLAAGMVEVNPLYNLLLSKACTAHDPRLRRMDGRGRGFWSCSACGWEQWRQVF